MFFEVMTMAVDEINKSAPQGLIEEISRFLRKERAASFLEIGAVVDGDSDSVTLALDQMRRDGLVDVRDSRLDDDKIAISTELLLRGK